MYIMNEGINQINIDVEIFILIKKVTYKEKANHIDLHTVMKQFIKYFLICLLYHFEIISHINIIWYI